MTPPLEGTPVDELSSDGDEDEETKSILDIISTDDLEKALKYLKALQPNSDRWTIDKPQKSTNIRTINLSARLIFTEDTIRLAVPNKYDRYEDILAIIGELNGWITKLNNQLTGSDPNIDALKFELINPKDQKDQRWLFIKISGFTKKNIQALKDLRKKNHEKSNAKWAPPNTRKPAASASVATAASSNESKAEPPLLKKRSSLGPDTLFEQGKKEEQGKGKEQYEYADEDSTEKELTAGSQSATPQNS